MSVYGLSRSCTIVIGTDGLWDFLPSTVIARLIQSASGQLAQDLCQEALSQGSSDNVTVALMRCL